MKKNYIETFETLTKNKLIKKNTNERYPNIWLYKYQRDVFYDNLWGTLETPLYNKILWLSRWIVLSDEWDIVSFPFDKVFNYWENSEKFNTLPEKNKEYYFVEKFNWFLWIISQNPFNVNELLIHTQGSIKDNDYIEYIKDLLSEEQETKLIQFMKEYWKHTFMFEVIHPNDPHVVQYEDWDFWLKLIWIRKIENNDIANSYLFKEEEIDNINDYLKSSSLNEGWLFNRPFYFVDLLSNILTKYYNNEYKNLEWFMVRDLENQEYIVKLKTPNYLIAKFLWRMNEKRYNLLYSNPEEFKKLNWVEEEFYPIIDFILENKEEFSLLSKEDKVLSITNFINNNY